MVVSTYRFWIELKGCRAGGVEHIKTVQYNIPHHQSDTALLCYPLQSSKLNIPRLLNFIPAVAASTSLWFTELN